MKTFQPVRSFLDRTLVFAKTLCASGRWNGLPHEVEQQERGVYVAGSTMYVCMCVCMSLILTATRLRRSYFSVDNTNGSANPSTCIVMEIRRNGSYTVSDGLEYVGSEVHMADSSVTLVSKLHTENGGNMCLRKV